MNYKVEPISESTPIEKCQLLQQELNCRRFRKELYDGIKLERKELCLGAFN
jgi:hypothetical protein